MRGRVDPKSAVTQLAAVYSEQESTHRQSASAIASREEVVLSGGASAAQAIAWIQGGLAFLGFSIELIDVS